MKPRNLIVVLSDGETWDILDYGVMIYEVKEYNPEGCDTLDSENVVQEYALSEEERDVIEMEELRTI